MRATSLSTEVKLAGILAGLSNVLLLWVYREMLHPSATKDHV